MEDDILWLVGIMWFGTLFWWLCVKYKYEDAQGRIWLKNYRQFRFHLNQEHLWEDQP